MNEDNTITTLYWETSIAGPGGGAAAGVCGSATAEGCGAAAAGDYGEATAGDLGVAAAGDCGAATAGYKGAATSRGKVSVGARGIACVRSDAPKARGGIGAVLVLAMEQNGGSDLLCWNSAVVDGEAIKADTWYTLDANGNFVEDPAQGELFL